MQPTWLPLRFDVRRGQRGSVPDENPTRVLWLLFAFVCKKQEHKRVYLRNFAANFEVSMRMLEAQEKGHTQAVSTVLHATETAQAAAATESISRVMAVP